MARHVVHSRGGFQSVQEKTLTITQAKKDLPAIKVRITGKNEQVSSYLLVKMNRPIHFIAVTHFKVLFGHH